MLVPSMQMISYTVIARECFRFYQRATIDDTGRSPVIVMLRTWAIYGGKIWPVILLASVYVTALGVQTVSQTRPHLNIISELLQYVAATSVTHVSMPPGVNGCLLGATPES